MHTKQPRSFATPAIILKRVNTGETDRILTLYTQERGKLAVIAKGCRQLKSSRLSLLEPGNLIKAYLVDTKSLPILTQTSLIDDFTVAKHDLKKIRQLWQILEMIDRLSVEEQDQQLFSYCQNLLQLLNSPRSQASKIKNQLDNIIEHLGYTRLDSTPFASFTEYISNLSDRPLKSYEYLTLKS